MCSRVQWLSTDPQSHGTSHLVTADSSGMATSLTTTINLFFGSGIMVPETGVIMNNEMAGMPLLTSFLIVLFAR